MPMRRLLSLAALAVALAVGGCDGTADDALDPQLVVSAQLGADEPLPPVFLSRVSPLLEVYDPERVAVSGATVTLTLLAADGSDETVFPYLGGADAGVYEPDFGAVGAVTAVRPGRTYRLDVTGPDGERLTARTTVPPTLTLIGEAPASVVYGEGQGPELRISRSTTAERRATFVASTRALDPSDFEAVVIDGETFFRSVPGTGALPVPIYRRFLDCEDEGPTLLCAEDPRRSEVVSGTSPVINEASYIDLGDGTLLVQVPFLAFGYYGPYSVRLTSLDAALEAFLEAQTVQSGGSTLSPGEIPNLVTNVEGGLGVVGSFARVTVETTIVEP